MAKIWLRVERRLLQVWVGLVHADATGHDPMYYPRQQAIPIIHHTRRFLTDIESVQYSVRASAAGLGGVGTCRRHWT
jgi:hypothetical protein